MRIKLGYDKSVLFTFFGVCLLSRCLIAYLCSFNIFLLILRLGPVLLEAMFS